MNQNFQTLVDELHHPDKNVRSKAAVSIGKLDDTTSVSILLDALITEPDMYVREDITWALVRVKDAALQPLIHLLDDANPSTRHLATHVLGKIGGPQVVDPLIHALHDTEPAVISKAAFGLAQIGDERAIPTLVSLVGHENSEVQTMLMTVLERFDKASVQPLIELMTSDRWQVREQAADILGTIDDKTAIPVLIEALKDEVWQVRFAAVTALGHLGGAEAAIEPMRDDPDPRVQELASQLMKRMKKRVKP
jgi:HEAT repeat protein